MPREIGGKRFRVSGYDTYVPARRRRLRRRRMAAAAGIGVVVLATGGWYGYHTVVDKPSSTPRAGAACVKPTTSAHARTSANATPVLSALTPGQVTVNVYNDTSRTGLAAITAASLKGRGFVIGKVSNDPVKETVQGTALVRGAKPQLARLQLIGAEVSGAQEVFDTRTDPSVDLVLGNGYGSLASTSEAATVVAADVKADNIAPTPTATPTCK